MVLEMTKRWSSKVSTYTQIRRRGLQPARTSCLGELSARAKKLGTGREHETRLETSAGRRSRHPCVSELVELNARRRRRNLARASRRRRPKFRQYKPSRPRIVSVHLRGNGATCLVPETFHSLVDVVKGISRPVRRPTRERGTRRRRQLQLDLP